MSSGYLLDTSVLSMLAPDRPSMTIDWSAWLRTHANDLYFTAIAVAEIEQGICKLRRAGGTERADRLSAWLDNLISNASDRLLPFDGGVGRIAGALSDQATAAGRHPGFADVAIAATAIAHDLILLTRNGRHFEPLGVAFVDPLVGLP